MTLTSKCEGAPKLCFHRQPQGLAQGKRAEQRVPGCSWLFARPWPHTPLIFQTNPEKLKETESRSEPLSPAPQNFSKLTELHSKTELLLGWKGPEKTPNPAHPLSEVQTEAKKSVSPPWGHTATGTRIRSRQQAPCKTRPTAHSVSK